MLPLPLATSLEASTTLNQAEDTITLAHSRTGQELVLVSVLGGKRMQERLISMGFPTGCSFHVQHNNRGAVVIGCACNRLAIGAGMAAKLIVRPVA